MKGWIYVLSNQSVPDWLAIGYADTDPAALVHQYGNSGIKLPYPFELQYALRTPYPKTLLQKIHDELAEKCVNPEHNSDWFECDLLTALRLVRKIAGHSATGEAFYGQARRLVEQARKRRTTTQRHDRHPFI
nr:GIY-YIG nuclease family protein [Alysiella crassa]UOP07587.1 GIY-YIG nuclease family protein [Alysiella crassa]